jgi:hypothetical protein
LKSLRFSSVGFDLCTRLVCLHQGAGLCVWTVQVLGMCPDFKFAGIETLLTRQPISGIVAGTTCRPFLMSSN